MGGGLLQLVAHGAQDSALTGTPQISFFRSVYRRHTNFAVESIPQVFIGTPGFGKKITASLSRNGDLVNGCVLEVDLPSIKNKAGFDFYSLRWVKDLGYHLIKRISVEIGGQKIDTHTGEWMHLWNQLSQPKSKDGDTRGWGSGYDAMIGNCANNSSFWVDNDGNRLKFDLSKNIVYVDKFNSDGSNFILHKYYSADGIENNPYHVLCNNNKSYSDIPSSKVYIPLKFWFNDPEKPGLALPLLALQYHEVKINIEFNPIEKLLVKWHDNYYTYSNLSENFNGIVDGKENVACYGCDVTSSDFEIINPDCFNAQLFVDYIYLDNEERRRFAQDNHEYLIPQVQYTGEECIEHKCKSKRYRMNFNHPVKELVWVVHQNGFEPSNYATYYGNNPVCKAKMTLNGHDRFSERDGTYFDCVQPYMHHTRCPTRGINVYSFALKPEQHQPSGTCNFSRIDNSQLELRLRDEVGASVLPIVDSGFRMNAKVARKGAVLRVYAVNYNLLRIMSGLGGLAYSN